MGARLEGWRLPGVLDWGSGPDSPAQSAGDLRTGSALVLKRSAPGGFAEADAPVVVKVLSTGPRGDLDRLPAQAARTTASAVDHAAGGGLRLPQRRGQTRPRAGGCGIGALLPDRQWSGHAALPSSERPRDGKTPGVSLASPTARLSFCTAGGSPRVKRLDWLLDAFAEVPGRLILAGEGNQEALLRAQVERLNLGSRVSMLPMQEDTVPLYRAADIYVSASSTEGMSGSVLFEAMSSAVPVVALPASGMTELLGGEAGSSRKQTRRWLLRS